jgi:hypothetical protein
VEVIQAIQERAKNKRRVKNKDMGIGNKESAWLIIENYEEI